MPAGLPLLSVKGICCCVIVGSNSVTVGFTQLGARQERDGSWSGIPEGERERDVDREREGEGSGLPGATGRGVRDFLGLKLSL